MTQLRCLSMHLATVSGPQRGPGRHPEGARRPLRQLSVPQWLPLQCPKSAAIGTGGRHPPRGCRPSILICLWLLQPKSYCTERTQPERMHKTEQKASLRPDALSTAPCLIHVECHGSVISCRCPAPELCANRYAGLSVQVVFMAASRPICPPAAGWRLKQPEAHLLDDRFGQH